MVKIIAEFCQNHNGDFNILKNMIHKAAESGATHAKIQTIYAKNLSFRPEFEEEIFYDGSQLSIKRPYKAEFERLKNLEINLDDSKKFISLCKEYNLVPMTTCFSRSNIKEIISAGFKSIKVASYDCASFPLIRELKEVFDEIIVSTGASFDDEIKNTANILNDTNFSFLHCVTLYPTPLDQMHLSRLNWLRKFTPNVGLSDHTLFERDGIKASLGALALGAEIIERHFTILPSNKTKDGPVSIDSSSLKSISDFAKLSIDERIKKINSIFPNWKVMLGQSKRKLTSQELLNRNYYRGRFASPREGFSNGEAMIFNWEETPLG
tara:strand:- start:199 stop:1167 length:969 start_codon:yes stop_codon:yes gene_type:complete